MLHVGGSEASALWLWVAFGFVFYLLPFAIALLRENGREVPILLINAVLGWTLVGWFAAMYLALHDDPKAPCEAVKGLRQKRATRRRAPYSTSNLSTFSS